MDTACLRIKFTPLIQTNQKTSKCCLEIVPEVSCLQNLDKLKWRRETNFIEYTIPMTYKVILKKSQGKGQQDLGDAVVDHVAKTYHSCVDLLLSSSKSTVNLASGDVPKIISDTFIFTKNIVNSPSQENFINSLTDCRNQSNKIENYPVSHNTTNTSMNTEITETKQEIKNIQDDEVQVNTHDAHVLQTLERVINLDKASLDKITNTENGYSLFCDTLQCGNAVIHSIPMSPTNTDITRKLSLSPICSISTQDTPIVTKTMDSKSVTCKIYDSQKDLIPLECISSPSDLSNENAFSNVLSTIIDLSGENSSKRLSVKCRVPPELRVAEYMQYVEKEILPLKMLLNDIYCKCNALGMAFSKKTSKQSLMFKSVSTYSGSPEMRKSEIITNSNRVVYSIVFDD